MDPQANFAQRRRNSWNSMPSRGIGRQALSTRAISQKISGCHKQRGTLRVSLPVEDLAVDRACVHEVGAVQRAVLVLVEHVEHGLL